MTIVKQHKEIRKIKLTLTTACNLACSYCFVKKTKERMGWDVAKKSIDLLLCSPGVDKLLSLYGGEPLLEKGLIMKIVEYAKRKAAKNKKKLTISICSNLTILDDEMVEFIKINDIKVTVSLFGSKLQHDKHRINSMGRGTYDVVVGNLTNLAKRVPRRNIGISFCVIPSLTGLVEENFSHILSLGFFNINFEIIQDFKPWKSDSIREFSIGFSNILLDVVKRIGPSGNVYINTINWELAESKLSEIQQVHCQAKYNIEVYPSGKMAFSPFLLNDKNSKQYLIGNALDGLLMKYKKCSFAPEKEACIKCEQCYYEPYKKDDGSQEMVMLYNRLSLEVSKLIKRKSSRNPLFRKYSNEARKYLGF